MSLSVHFGLSQNLKSQEDEDRLWAERAADGEIETREALFSLYLPYARRIARRHLLSRSHNDIEFDELLQLASVGLLEAIDGFDPKIGTPFRAYAKRRIAGSVLDGIAKMSEVREQISFRNRVRRDRMRSMQIADADDLEVADAMQALTDLAVGLALGFMLDGTNLYVDEDQVAPQADAYESLAWKDTVRTVVQAISTLPDKEQNVVRRHYLEGLAFEQIGRLLGLSKGRISQLHKAGLERLRSRLSRLKGFNVTR